MQESFCLNSRGTYHRAFSTESAGHFTQMEEALFNGEVLLLSLQKPPKEEYCGFTKKRIYAARHWLKPVADAASKYPDRVEPLIADFYNQRSEWKFLTLWLPHPKDGAPSSQTIDTFAHTLEKTAINLTEHAKRGPGGEEAVRKFQEWLEQKDHSFLFQGAEFAVNERKKYILGTTSIFNWKVKEKKLVPFDTSSEALSKISDLHDAYWKLRCLELPLHLPLRLSQAKKMMDNLADSSRQLDEKLDEKRIETEFRECENLLKSLKEQASLVPHCVEPLMADFYLRRIWYKRRSQFMQDQESYENPYEKSAIDLKKHAQISFLAECAVDTFESWVKEDSQVSLFAKEEDLIRSQLKKVEGE